MRAPVHHLILGVGPQARGVALALGVAKALRAAYPAWPLTLRLVRPAAPGEPGLPIGELGAAWPTLQGVAIDAARPGPEGWTTPASARDTNEWLLPLDEDEIARAAGSPSSASWPDGDARRLQPDAALCRALDDGLGAGLDALGLRMPAREPADAGPRSLHRLARRSGWSLVLRVRQATTWTHGGRPTAGCDLRLPVHDPRSMDAALAWAHAHWPNASVLLEAAPRGERRLLTWSAWRGRLLGAAWLHEANGQAPETALVASTTASPSAAPVRVTPLDSASREALAATLAARCWTGGGTLECLLDTDGQRWLQAIRPCWPEAVHGLVLCGLNLPALLVDAALAADGGKPAHPATSSIAEPSGPGFMRLMQELPWTPQDDGRTWSPGAPVTAEARPPMASATMPAEPATVSSAPHGAATPAGSSPLPPGPRREDTHDDPLQSPNLRALLYTLDALPPGLPVRPALSIKTDPRGVLARAYRARGWLAEAISDDEYDWALAQGFEAREIVLNGPVAPASPRRHAEPFRLAFADSMTALSSMLAGRRHASPSSGVVGLRLRPACMPSRFGVPLGDDASWSSLLHVLDADVPGEAIALHMHLPADVIGPRRWREGFDELLRVAARLRKRSGLRLAAIDIGGGWHADDFVDVFLPMLRDELVPAVRALGDVGEMLLEPGKAIAAPLARLVTTVREVRPAEQALAGHRADTRDHDVVLDASITDLPMALHHPHPVEHWRDGRCLGSLPGGGSRLLGAVCMEADVLARGVGFTVAPRMGDQLVFGQAGGYDRSLASRFARGGRPDDTGDGDGDTG